MKFAPCDKLGKKQWILYLPFFIFYYSLFECLSLNLCRIIINEDIEKRKNLHAREYKIRCSYVSFKYIDKK